ncbi:hypothetical protein LEP1GSC016_3005 [Leptospira borgpetersenii serovar Hardjo-bovis str. Sponselee]|uniref:Uncharacterized protein n=1 Tax=Leptospira borgpetersenii serovar Hardjo-bovis str. Sponselee TaxID=1303729 RepID=M6BKM6_LEPBO|nr:hypothetical protein LEP1GSC016_3005 [Leptospira borgpetersenii serovar Hardjo-bovis str. Sponselee]
MKILKNTPFFKLEKRRSNRFYKPGVLEKSNGVVCLRFVKRGIF